MNLLQNCFKFLLCYAACLGSTSALQATELLNQAPAGNAGLFVGIETFNSEGDVGALEFSVESAIEMAHLFAIEMRLIPAENCFLCLSNPPVAQSKHEAMLNRLKEQVAKDSQGRTSLSIRGGSKAEIMNSLLMAASKGESHGQNVLVCYFTTHGFEQETVPYLVPTDGSSNEFIRHHTALDFDFVQKLISEQSKAGHKMIFCDACREVKQYGVKSLEHRILGRQLDRKAFEAFSDPTPGIYKVLSCGSNQFSYEDPELEHGVFTYYLMKAIREEHPDNDQEGTLEVTLGNVVRQAKADVEAWSIRKSKQEQKEYNQTPMVFAEDEASRIQFEKLPLTRYVAVWSTLNWLETVIRHPSFRTEKPELWEEAKNTLNNFEQSNAYHKRVAEIVANLMAVNDMRYFEYQMGQLLQQKPIYEKQVSKQARALQSATKLESPESSQR